MTNMFSPCALGHSFGLEWPPSGTSAVPLAVCRRCGVIASSMTVGLSGTSTTAKEQQ